MLGLEAEARASAVSRTALTHLATFEVVPGVKLYPGFCGEDLHIAAASGFPGRGGKNRLSRALPQYIIEVVTAGDLQLRVLSINAFTKSVGGGEIEAGPPDVFDFSCRDHEGVDRGNLSGHDDGKPDPMAVEGLTGKAYAIPNRRIAQDFVQSPATLAYWRSVGNSMNGRPTTARKP